MSEMNPRRGGVLAKLCAMLQLLIFCCFFFSPSNFGAFVAADFVDRRGDWDTYDVIKSFTFGMKGFSSEYQGEPQSVKVIGAGLWRTGF